MQCPRCQADNREGRWCHSINGGHLEQQRGKDYLLRYNELGFEEARSRYVTAVKVKGDERYKNLPLVLVTSLESLEDKRRGMEAGADYYITKGGFDQRELLETIERLVG